MKRLLAIVLALVMLLALAGCGGKTDAPAENPAVGSESAGSFGADIGSVAADGGENAPYVDEPATSNALDPGTPIPPDTGTLELTEQTFDIPQLTIAGTADMKMEAVEDGVTVTSGDGVWTIAFLPFENHQKANLINAITNYYISAGVDVFPDRSEAETTLAGFPAQVYARNIHPDYLDPQDEEYVPALEILLDYGTAQVGKWAGLRIRLTSNDFENYANIYDVLNLRHVRAVLNNFRVNEGDAGVTVSAAGITVTFPSSWESNENTTGPWAGIFESSDLIGALYFKPGTPADPHEAAAASGGETFDWSCDGTDYAGEIRNWAQEGETPNYQLNLYTEFSNDRCLAVTLSLFAGQEDPAVLKDYIETDIFKNVIRSVALDPAGIPGLWISVDDTGLRRNADGVITGYDGTDEEIVIPEVISGVEIKGIGYGAFGGNTTITKVTLPETLEYIDEYAFHNCSNLETVEFASTRTIEEQAFEGCTSLRDVVLPETVTYVGGSNFEEIGKGSFTALGATKFGSECFSGSTFETISIGPNSDLSENLIFERVHAEEIHLGDGITTLGFGCFANASDLKSVNIPDSVTEIGEAAFNWAGIQELRIPEGVTEIHASTYSTESGIAILPASVKHIETLGITAPVVMLQSNDVELDETAIDTDVLLLPNVYGRDDVGFILDKQHMYVDLMILIAMDASRDQSDAFDDYLIEQGFDDISWFGLSADRTHYNLDDFRFEDETVAEYTGDDTDLCIPLLSPDQEYWGWRLGDGLFAGSGIRSVTLHSYVREMGSGVFDGCQDLTDIWFTTDILRCSEPDAYDFASDAFAGVPDDVTVHVPACLTDTERNTVEDFLRSAGMPGSVTYDYYSLQ